jgi:hypothetical protein
LLNASIAAQASSELTPYFRRSPKQASSRNWSERMNANAVIRVLVMSLGFAGIVTPHKPVLAPPLTCLDDTVRLEFVVLDDETSLPVRGAAVRVIDPFGDESHDRKDLAALSDDRGRAALSRNFDLGELVNDLRDGGGLKVRGWRVIVAAPGYQTSTTPLLEHTGEVIDIENLKVKRPTILLHLRKNAKTGAASECDTYVYGDWGWRISLIFYGGKFDAVRSCPKLCSQHTPWFEAKNGAVKGSGGALQLSVEGQELIRRRAGEKEVEWLINNLVPVNWGKRRYLVPQQQGIAFCNSVNLGEEPRDNGYGDFALGEGHKEFPVTGLPEVPAQWAGYLLKSPVRGEVIELLPGFKAKVNIGRIHGLRAGMELVPTKEYLFSDMEILSVDERESLIRTKYHPERR